MKKRHFFARIITILIFPVFLVLLWQLVVTFNFVPRENAASPVAVFLRLVTLLISSDLLIYTAYSLGRLIVGVAAGSLIGIIIGVLLTSFPSFRRFFSPTIQFLAGVPVVLWLPFCVMFFGTDEAFKISVVTISTLFLIYGTTFQAMLGTSNSYIELSEIYEKTVWERIRHIILPSALPAIFTGIRVAVAIGWIVLFFVEFAASEQGKEGLGWFINNARQVGKIEEQFAGLIFLALVAFFLDHCVGMIQRWKLAWSDSINSLHNEGNGNE